MCYSTAKFREEGGWAKPEQVAQYSQPRLKMAINPVEYYETDQIERITQTSDMMKRYCISCLII